MTMPLTRSWTIRLGLWVAVYLLIAVVAHLYAGSMLYQPRYGSHREVPGMIRLHGADGGEIAALWLPNPKARFTLWYFHGNAEDLGDIAPHLQALHDAGFSVFAFDYPGYGLSSGQPGEKAIYAAAHTARIHLRETLKVPASATILLGRSLGGGPATQLATEEPVAGLVLQSAFTSVYRVVTHWRLLPFDMFENLRKLPKVTSPVLVMHGRQDQVIPFSHGEALFAAAREPKQNLWLPAAGHNNLVESAGPAYWKALQDFADLCAKNPPTAGPEAKQ